WLPLIREIRSKFRYKRNLASAIYVSTGVGLESILHPTPLYFQPRQDRSPMSVASRLRATRFPPVKIHASSGYSSYSIIAKVVEAMVIQQQKTARSYYFIDVIYYGKRCYFAV